MDWTREKALKDISVLTIAQYAVQFCVVLKGFLFGKYLGPEGLGVWAAIHLFFTYGQYNQLGILNAASIIVPKKIGAGQLEDANRYLSSVITWINVFGFLFFLCMVIYVNLSSSTFISSYWIPILIISLAVTIHQNYFFSYCRLQYNHNFKKSGLYQITFSVFDLVLSFILLLNFGITGACAGMLFSLFLIVLLMYKESFKNLKISFNKFTFKELFATGFQLLLITFSFTFITTADKFSVANFFSSTYMGIFSMASSIAMLPYTIAAAMNGVILQRMLEEYGKTNNLESIKIFLREGTASIAFLIPTIAVLLIALAELLTPLLLPKYVESLNYIGNLSIGIYFFSIGVICYSFLIVCKRYFIIIATLILLSGMVVFCVSFVAKFNMGFQWVSLLTIANYFLFTFVLYWFAYKNYIKTMEILIKFFKIALPVLIIFIAFSIKFICVDKNILILIRFAIAGIWGIISYYYLSKHTTIIAQMIMIIKNKFKFTE
jgi:O-antigen/teichoic acid export membrane protein